MDIFLWVGSQHWISEDCKNVKVFCVPHHVNFQIAMINKWVPLIFKTIPEK